MHQVFECPISIKTGAMGYMFIGIYGVLGYKLWDPKNMCIILSKDVFDETSVRKSSNLVHVKSGKTRTISRRVEMSLHRLQEILY